MLCQVSCAETQGNENTKHFVRRNTNSILWRSIYVVLQLPGVPWQQVTAGHGWKHVKWGGSVCLFCQLLPALLWDW